MSLYADTSALIKKTIREAGSEKVGCAALTKAEMASAMSKAARLGWVEEYDQNLSKAAQQEGLQSWPEDGE